MPSYRAPINDMQFLLHQVFDAESLFTSMPETEEVTADLLNAIIEEAGKLTEGVVSPINQSGDEEGCHWNDGKVTTPKGFKEAYQAYAEGGWSSLTGDINYGGQGMPKMMSAIIEEMLFAANTSFALYNVLSTGASLALRLHGSEDLKQTYLPKLYEGKWAGSMCLTEPHAGTDLGIINTKAVPSAEGSYLVSGTKIFITAGEHDLTENIIHLVLAKLPDAPAGPRGISLFLVPKYKVDSSGETSENFNNVRCGSIEHKMGIRASATCVLNFDAAEGYLVGELNQGLACMFTMMNYERLSMALQGNGLADSSYQLAAEYAKERVQGRAASGAQQPDKAADSILVHPDVRRMLLTMRANVMAGRALALYTATKLDIAKFHPDEEQRRLADDLVSLLIPIAKAYSTDKGFEACVLGQQVLGGHGYIAEWGLEQNVRDARIAQIYEGTNGVQALDLMGRKTVRSKGRLLECLLVEVEQFIAEQADNSLMSSYLPHLVNGVKLLRGATQTVLEKSQNDPNEIGAASYAYMELSGLVVYCFMWQRMLAAATQEETITTMGKDYIESLVKTGEFFFARLMPRCSSLVTEIEAGAESLMALTAEHF